MIRTPIRLTVASIAAGVVLAVTAAAGTALAGTALAGSTPAGSTPIGHPPAGAPDKIRPGDAQQAILAAFDKYEVVGGMGPDHGVKDVDDFIIDLIRNPKLPGKVNDIAVECGNSLYQPILDRYIAGDDVPLADVRKVWRNTTQPSCGFSTFYEELFPLVRLINEKLPQAKKLRVVACDPPVDWGKVHNLDDFMPFTERDTNVASVMEKEVLSKHRKALMLFGLGHMTHGSGAVGMYERHYPNSTYVIADHRGFSKDNDALENRMASWPVPSLAPVKGGWLDRLDTSYFEGFPGEWGSAFVDAYLYVGRRSVLMHQPISSRTVLDKDYVAELTRRANTIGDPPDGPMRPEGIFREESASSTFFYVARP